MLSDDETKYYLSAQGVQKIILKIIILFYCVYNTKLRGKTKTIPCS